MNEQCEKRESLSWPNFAKGFAAAVVVLRLGAVVDVTVIYLWLLWLQSSWTFRSFVAVVA